jgi:two-component system response regulator DevR
VLLVDDHEIVLAGLTLFLRRAAGIQVVGEARSMAAAVEAAAKLSPDVILMDLRLPDGSGIDACREILSDHPATRVLFLSSYPDEDAVMATMMAGASGYLIKDIAHPALEQAILDVAAGKTITDAAITGRMKGEFQRIDDLSPQEKRVLALVVEGRTNKEIAEALTLSVKTVKNYLPRLRLCFSRTGAPSPASSRVRALRARAQHLRAASRGSPVRIQYSSCFRVSASTWTMRSFNSFMAPSATSQLDWVQAVAMRPAELRASLRLRSPSDSGMSGT